MLSGNTLELYLRSYSLTFKCFFLGWNIALLYIYLEDGTGWLKNQNDSYKPAGSYR